MMRSVVKFEHNIPTNDAAGGQVDYYSELLTTRGYLRKSNGFRNLEAGETLLNSSYVMFCRIQSALANEINETLRVLCDNRFFTIVSYEQVDQKNFMYKFRLNESE